MNKKVFLLSPNSVDELNPNLIAYSMALGYLGAYAEKAGWEPVVRDCYCSDWENTKKQILDVIKKEKPSVVGINCITMNRFAAYNSIDLIKKIDQKIIILVGGVHPTIFPEHFLINHAADIVVMHEGEETFEELLKKFSKDDLLKAKSLKNIRGIAYKENGQVKINLQRKQIENLDSMPFMKHDFFMNKDSTKAYFFSSRGCPNNCSFCSASIHWGRMWRFRSPEKVVDEIEQVVKKYPKVNEIRFMDDTFTLNNQRVIDICKEMIKRNIQVKWRCSGRVFPVSLEMLKWMEKAGCIMVSFGVETGSTKLLQEIGKNQTIDQIYNAFKLVYENTKITPEMFFIIGFPNEDKTTIWETIILIKKIIDVSKKPLILTAARMLEIYPGTRIYDLAKNKGMIDDNYWLSNPKTPIYLEKSESWLKKQRNRILYANWTYAGFLPVVKLFIEKKMWKPRKIYNIIRPYLTGLN